MTTVKFGFLSMNTMSPAARDSIRPSVAAKEAEARGFESFWVPEHSHIPTSRRSPYPNGGDLPEGYLHMMDPFVSLTDAAMHTENMVLATGVCLILEHDLLALACRVASLDVVSGGRVLLGIGVGWNREELANHRPDLPFKKRYGAMRERVEALRAMWSQAEPSYEGTWERFSPSWVYPKPVNGTVPIALGNAGPLGLRHAARYADHWCPVDSMLIGADGRPDAAGAVARFRQMIEEEGRDPAAVGISVVMFSRPTDARIERYANAGVERVVLTAPTALLQPASYTMKVLDEAAPLVAAWR